MIPPEDTMLPIRTVAALTGVNPVTLRAWERRYGIVRPRRTATGHRLYTHGQVEEIQRVLALLRSGVSIGQVRAALGAPPQPEAAERSKAWATYRRRMWAAIAAFDEQELDTVYEEALSLHNIDRVNRDLIVPLLEDVGARWGKVAGGVAEEHFFTAYLRNKLGARFHHRRLSGSGSKLLAACVPDEHHELGLLSFALAAHEAGMRVVMLGANVPFAEIGAAARRAQCDAVVLSSSIHPLAGDFLDALARLVGTIGRPVFVGGATAAKNAKALERAGALALAATIETAVRRIQVELRKNA